MTDDSPAPGLVLLTLVVPVDLEEALADLLLRVPDLAGFTVVAAEGHGTSVALVEPAERVHGYADRVYVQTVAPRAQADALLATIRSALPHANLYFWITPVLAGGRLA